MINKIYSNFQKLNYFKKFLSLFVFSSWLLLLLSVGSNSSEFIISLKKIFLLNLENIEIIKFSYFRSGIVIFIFISLTCLLFYLWIIKKKITLKIQAEDIFIILLIIYYLIAFIGLNFSCNYNNNSLDILGFTCQFGQRTNYIFSLHFIISSMCLILIYLVCTTQKNNIYIEFFHFFALLFFILILSICIILMNDLQYGGIHLKVKFINFDHYINSNGAGRILLIFNIFLYSLFYSNFFANNTNKLLVKLILIITTTIIFSLEGKFNFLGITVLFLIYNFYVSKNTLKIKFNNLLILFILPIIIFQLNIFFEKNYRYKIYCNNNTNCEQQYLYTKDFNSNRILNLDSVLKEEFSINIKEEKEEKEEIEKIPDKPYLDTRKEKWSFLINDFLERKYYFGNGPEYDRQLLINLAIKKGAKNFVSINSDAANAFVYSLLTSGVFGPILYLYACLYSLIILTRYILSKKNKSVIVNFALFSLLAIMARSLIETGFVSWNFDQFILISSLIILKLNSNQLKI